MQIKWIIYGLHWSNIFCFFCCQCVLSVLFLSFALTGKSLLLLLNAIQLKWQSNKMKNSSDSPFCAKYERYWKFCFVFQSIWNPFSLITRPILSLPYRSNFRSISSISTIYTSFSISLLLRYLSDTFKLAENFPTKKCRNRRVTN